MRDLRIESPPIILEEVKELSVGERRFNSKSPFINSIIFLRSFQGYAKYKGLNFKEGFYG